MYAMVLRRPRAASAEPLRREERPDPRPGPGRVVVRVEACAVCRTDLQLVEGDLRAHRLPVVPGHQVVGRIETVGEGVDPGWVGQRVGAYWLADACGACHRCREGRENLCAAARFTGWDVDGGYAQLMEADPRFLVRLPTDVAAPAIAPLLCAGIIGYRSLRVSTIAPGERLGLFGFGASARSALQVARHNGCRVFVCTRGAEDRRRARELGAEWVGGFAERPPEPLDAAITFAPVGEAIVHALTAVDRGGTVAVNAIHLDRVPEFPYRLLWHERSLRSVANVTRADAHEFLERAFAIPIGTDHHEYPLNDANRALADLAAGRVRGSAVLVP
ncbi:MAG TPA: zinc-dependent alcohol dehydrogenase family protein [Miltoncostaeaceae bacterium]|nr:zinc-dependent alcohol dehydrogenase family protein [Miltoncostaeaceae bacterium]